MTRILAPVAFALALGAAAPASAQSAEAKQVCDAMKQLATAVMQQRQQGVPMDTVMGFAAGAEGKVKEIVINTIRNAYATPRYGSAKAQASAVAEFETTATQNCLASF